MTCKCKRCGWQGQLANTTDDEDCPQCAENGEDDPWKFIVEITTNGESQPEILSRMRRLVMTELLEQYLKDADMTEATAIAILRQHKEKHKKRKILVSYGYGAGWGYNDQRIAEYQPIIDYLENGGDRNDLTEAHPIIRQMVSDLNLGSFYTGGREGLEVREVTPPYYLDEYDGAERPVEFSDLWQ